MTPDSAHSKSTFDKISHKMRLDITAAIQESKLEAIKKLERKKLDLEIIKDNITHQPT